MDEITFQKISPADKMAIECIADWNHQEWQVEKELTRQTLSQLPPESVPFHLFMVMDGKPVASGGLYHEVRLLKVYPRFQRYDPWLALVVTVPGLRNQGLSYRMCEEIQRISRTLGLKKIYLYTITAESLQERASLIRMNIVQ